MVTRTRLRHMSLSSPRRARGWPRSPGCTRVVIIACLTLLATLPCQSPAQEVELPNRYAIQTPGVQLSYPDGWMATRSANLDMLYHVPAGQLATLDAQARATVPHIAVSTERRKDHAEALHRLKEIEAEVSSPVTFLAIGGWPALQRQHLQARPQPGQDQAIGDDSDTILVLTTAVAADDLLVRLEAWLPADALPEVTDEVDAIGRSLRFTTTGAPPQVEQELQKLRTDSRLRFSSAAPRLPTPGAAEGATADATEAVGATVAVTQQAGRDSELEIAVSANGRNIVIGSNNGYHFSTDAGQTWSRSTGLGNNDPSLAWGPSGGTNGTFYAANIASPSTAISVSTNNGVTFTFRANAYTCGQNGNPACGTAFPDQEHITADRFNVTAGGDQVYSAWRHLNGTWGIVCSVNGGATWSTNGFFTGGDFPRLAVGQDGFVYVVFLQGNNIRLSKFNTCETNQNPMVKAIADQTVVAGMTHVACPTPGLDRCNLRNTLASPTVAVDDTDPNHVYVAYAVNTNPGGGGFPTCANQNTCNERVVVQDSLNGGATWNAADPNRTVTVSTGVTARRFMPWVCAVGGVAHVTWYDRRAARPGGTVVSNNSLTDFFGASAFLNASGNLRAGTEFRINEPGTTDAQCEAGFAAGSIGSWPFPVDNQNDSESCSVQPQFGGRCCAPADIDGNNRCLNPSAASTLQRCDFSPDTCPAGQRCAANRGSPKYGDYNGNACAAGRLYMTWASATAPAPLPVSRNIDAFFSSQIVCCVPQIQAPSSVTLAETCVGSTATTTLNVCNTGVENLEVSALTSSNGQFAVVAPTSGYPVVISHDFCFPFTLRFAPTTSGPASATLTIRSNDPVSPVVTVQATGAGTPQPIATTIANNGNFGDVCSGAFSDLDLTISNPGRCPLSVTGIASSSADFKTAQVLAFPLVIEPGNARVVPIRFQPTSSGAKAANITVSTSNPATPSQIIPVSGSAPPGDIRVTVSPDFGDLCTEPQAAKTVAVCNVGACTLRLTSIAFTPACADFQLMTPPLPTTVSPNACHYATLLYTPTSVGPTSCTLGIASDDPDMPNILTAISAQQCGP